MKVSDYLVSYLVNRGVRNAFSVTGGAAMHLNDSAGSNPNLEITYMHNEQSCSMAAEGYARIAKSPALVIVTAGPGAINSFNGVFGAFTDSIPMLIVAGQAKTSTLKSTFGLDDLRQLGDQEAPILAMVQSITKAQYLITANDSAEEVHVKISEALALTVKGRPGPVWIEIPVDVQGMELNFDEIVEVTALLESDNLGLQKLQIDALMEAIKNAKRPIFLFGSGIQISNTAKEAIALASKLQIPVLTAWSHDTIASSHDLFFGRPGTIGTRPGNIIIQSADLIVILGSRLNIRQIGYNFEQFAPNAFKIQIDVDYAEINKPFPKIDLGIHIGLSDFFASIHEVSEIKFNLEQRTRWLNWCRMVNDNFSVKNSDYLSSKDSINPYHLVPGIINSAPSNTIFACGDATACIVPFQTAHIREGVRMFSNSGSASMGYDLPAAIGASIAEPSATVVCFAGDGSLMMNLQELQTLYASGRNIMLVILNNGGYLSIKQTQINFFGRLNGSTAESGISFPDFYKVASSFGLETIELTPENWQEEVSIFLKKTNPRVVVAKLDRDQEFIPRLKSKVVNGQIQTPPLHDMYPHLDSEVLAKLMESAPN
jgi:acetolactate synthase-1/2/3 large subunit